MWEIEDLIDMIAVDMSVLSENKALYSEQESYDALKNITKRLSLDVKPVIDAFLDKNNIGIEEMPQYYCSPLWGDVCSNFKWRYVVIRDNANYTLVMFRVIGLYSTQRYFAVSYRPLCLDATKPLSRVIEWLKNVKCIKKIAIIDNEDYEEVNFYNDCLPKLDSWKLKKAKALIDDGISVEVYTNTPSVPSSVLHGIQELYDIYSVERFRFDRRTHDKYLRIALERRLPVFVFMYNKRVIGIKLCSDDWVGTFSIHAAKDISTFPVEVIAEKITDGDAVFAKRIKCFLGFLCEWYINKYLFDNYHCKAVFYDGLFEKSKKGLVEHKRIFYKKIIGYKFINIEDYDDK